MQSCQPRYFPTIIKRRHLARGRMEFPPYEIGSCWPLIDVAPALRRYTVTFRLWAT
jgi:hypothetical protein